MRLSGTDVGHRVVVRRRVPGGLSDLLGVLSSWTTDGLTVETVVGPVAVPAGDVVAGKRVPARPARR